jgi:hypothetical protein
MERPETCRAFVKINKFKKSCILLAVICNYITINGHKNIKFYYWQFAIKTDAKPIMHKDGEEVTKTKSKITKIFFSDLIKKEICLQNFR